MNTVPVVMQIFLSELVPIIQDVRNSTVHNGIYWISLLSHVESLVTQTREQAIFPMEIGR